MFHYEGRISHEKIFYFFKIYFRAESFKKNLKNCFQKKHNDTKLSTAYIF
jgi:hypothetical protein